MRNATSDTDFDILFGATFRSNSFVVKDEIMLIRQVEIQMEFPHYLKHHPMFEQKVVEGVNRRLQNAGILKYGENLNRSQVKIPDPLELLKLPRSANDPELTILTIEINFEVARNFPLR